MIFTITELNFYKWKHEDKYCKTYAFNNNKKNTIIILTIMILTRTNVFFFFSNTCLSLTEIIERKQHLQT